MPIADAVFCRWEIRPPVGISPEYFNWVLSRIAEKPSVVEILGQEYCSRGNKNRVVFRRHPLGGHLLNPVTVVWVDETTTDEAIVRARSRLTWPACFFVGLPVLIVLMALFGSFVSNLSSGPTNPDMFLRDGLVLSFLGGFLWMVRLLAYRRVQRDQAALEDYLTKSESLSVSAPDFRTLGS